MVLIVPFINFAFSWTNFSFLSDTVYHPLYLFLDPPPLHSILLHPISTFSLSNPHPPSLPFPCPVSFPPLYLFVVQSLNISPSPLSNLFSLSNPDLPLSNLFSLSNPDLALSNLFSLSPIPISSSLTFFPCLQSRSPPL